MYIIMSSLEITVLTKIKNNLLMQVDDINTRLQQLSADNYTYVCDITKLSFVTLEDYEKYKKSKKYYKAAGIESKKCKLCNNTFYGDDFKLHITDGRCEHSRTDKETGIVYDNMNKKSRAKKEKKDEPKPVRKKKKSPKKKKQKVVEPKPTVITMEVVVPEGFAEPNEKVEVEPELYSHVTKEKSKEKKEPMFDIGEPKHTLIDLPDFCDEVTPTWYNRLHRNMTKNDAYFVEKERNWSAIDNTYEDCPLYMKNKIIYSKTDDKPLWELYKIKGHYYDLVDVEGIDETDSFSLYDADKQLTTITDGMKITGQIYLDLHRDLRTKDDNLLTEDYKQKRFDHYTQISNYTDLVYFDGFLMENSEYIYKIHELNNLIYDIEEVENEEERMYNEEEPDSSDEEEIKEL